MKHTVIVPLYNKAAYVEAALESVWQQTCMPHELIIVDDASSDGSLQKVQAFVEQNRVRMRGMELQIIELLQNRGPGYARNLGIEQAQGDIISFLDADDMLAPSYTDLVKRAMQQYGIDMLVMGIGYVPGNERDPDLHRLSGRLQALEPELYRMLDPLETICSEHFVMGVGCNVVVHRKWLQNVRFDEKVRLHENIDFWYRVLRRILVSEQAACAGLHAGTLLQVRIVPGSLSRRSYGHWKEIEYPVLLQRYHNSSDPWDRRLAGVTAKRWFQYLMQHTPSPLQKIACMWHYRRFLYRYAGNLVYKKGNV